MALEIVRQKQKSEAARIKKLRDYFWSEIKKTIPKVSLNGSLASRLPNNLNVSFQNVEGEGILVSLDLVGISAATGSACSSHSLAASPVILAISNNNHLRAHSSIRFSLGRATTKAELQQVIKKLPPIITRLRQVSPFKK